MESVERDVLDGRWRFIRTNLSRRSRAPRQRQDETGPGIGTSPAWCEVLSRAMQVARTDTTVCLHGESGTGKEVVARLIHHRSPRSRGPFVAINCAALPEQLVESELFGFERGAFTGAQQAKLGLFELAQDGVLFLDEISELSLPAQAKLLRVLEHRECVRLGGTRPVTFDVRVIAATNCDLAAAVADGRFRHDLYYRVHVFEIGMPPLRARGRDILLFAQAFLEEFARVNAMPIPELTSSATDALLSYGWPGNVRELRNVLECALIVSEGRPIGAEHLSLTTGRGVATTTTADLRLLERTVIEQVMREVKGNKARAAQRLGISRTQLYGRLRKYSLYD